MNMLSEEEKSKIDNSVASRQQQQALIICNEIIFILEKIKQERHGKNNRSNNQNTTN